MVAEERFWDKVQVGSPSECWVWCGSRSGGRYGKFYFEGKLVQAHRYSYMLHYGEILPGLVVCHKCDNEGCVNPYHLFVGTQKDNVQDMFKKGRDNYARGSNHGSKTHPECCRHRADNFGCRKGEKNGRSVLTKHAVLQIRSLAECGVSRRKIARMFGVGKTTVDNVVHRRTWADVEQGQ